MYADRDVPGAVRDDPYLLMASLKNLKNLNKAEEMALCKRWLSKLHASVVGPADDSEPALPSGEDCDEPAEGEKAMTAAVEDDEDEDEDNAGAD